MTSGSHPRFRLLIGWCCLMSSALLMITVYIFIRTESSERSGESTTGNSTAIYGNTYQQIGLSPGPSSNDYIHLIRDDKEIWICHPCTSSTLSLKNGSVEITVSGLYNIYAQVTFQSNQKCTVALRKNGSDYKKERILSKVKHSGAGTVTMMRLVELQERDSISLEIDPINGISREHSDTYWEIMFLTTNNKQV
ncbi:lymphotoxin-alpha [Carassius carassius]|uniref:lymphotoxin-alpha n=1 Tax=Carassius carassius TaxID=217509 RepID=UPI00286933B3|nr:lymphotoxin-alpha [Carassius carassius]XP_059371063.1 lymphotoxin-alpha [Carassius carassius]